MVDAKIQFTVRSSFYLLFINLFIHVGAVICLWLAVLPCWLQLIISAMVAGHFVFWLRREFLLLQHNSIVSTIIMSDACYIQFKAGYNQAATLLPMSVVTRYLIILCFALPGNFRSIVLLPDSVSKDTLRQLRVWLWYKRKTCG